MFENLLDPVFRPLLQLGYFWSILIVSFILTLIITLVYKYATDQNMMKKLKQELKDMQKEIKKHSGNPSKAMSLQKKMMEKNMQYMKHSFKPTLYTFIPIIIIFGWLNAHMAYLPLEPNTEFMISAQFKEGTFGEATLDVIPELELISEPTQKIDETYNIVWTVKGAEGEYLAKITFGSRVYEKNLILTSETNYVQPIKVIKDSELVKIKVHNQVVKPLGNISLLGWKPGWLGTYILFSLIFSFGLRKILNIS